MVDEIIFVIPILFPEVGFIGPAGRLDLFHRSGEADHALVQIERKLPNDFGRIPIRVDGNEDRRHVLSAFIQNVDHLGVARYVQRTDIGAERVPEIDQRRTVQNILIRDRLTLRIEQFERTADLIAPAGHIRCPALSKLVGRLRNNGCKPNSTDNYDQKSSREYNIETGHESGLCRIQMLNVSIGTPIKLGSRCNRHRIEMAESGIGLFSGQHRNNWIRLRTLILLRWIAIIGQISALTIAQRVYHLQLEVGLCYLAIGISVIGNLIAVFVFPESKRLSEFENFLMVLFDLLQLAFLLYLTGGLHNPFALLLLAPVTVAANVMGLRSTLFICTTAVILVTVLAEFHLPLRTQNGFIHEVPPLFVYGNWVAIIIAIIFMSAYSRRINSEMRNMGDALAATQLALSREQKLTDLGGVVAAAAHELGTPLATIKLASAELVDELDERPDLKEDANLIREQADRCRVILRDMGRAGKDDLHLRQAPLSAVVNEAAEPHLDRDKIVHFEEGPASGGGVMQPTILRKPEIIHGLRNLIQNAVDFSRENVWVQTSWTDDQISVRIVDDGRGYPPQLIGRIGDPFMRRRRAETERKKRPEYEGMGLGLFIAKTLLERTGAQLRFSNASEGSTKTKGPGQRRGAVVEVTWPRSKIDAQEDENLVPIGQNQPIEI